jgi:hypothetical protein
MATMTHGTRVTLTRRVARVRANGRDHHRRYVMLPPAASSDASPNFNTYLLCASRGSECAVWWEMAFLSSSRQRRHLVPDACPGPRADLAPFCAADEWKEPVPP